MGDVIRLDEHLTASTTEMCRNTVRMDAGAQQQIVVTCTLPEGHEGSCAAELVVEDPTTGKPISSAVVSW